MLHRELLPNGQIQLTFSLPVNDPPGEVSVVGDFNEWRAGQHRMVLTDDIRQVSVTVEPGTHYFRYLASGGRWADERDADLITDHGSVVHCQETLEVIAVPEQATADRPGGDMAPQAVAPANTPAGAPMDTRMDADSDVQPESMSR